MFKALRFIVCIFLTSSCNSAWADFCFDNTNQNGVMAQKICFKEIKVLKQGTRDQRIYLKTSDIEDIFAFEKFETTASGFAAQVRGDYINYSENCGLTILSRFDFRFTLNSQYQYMHNQNAVVDVNYKYTPNNCEVKSKSGTETFTARP